MAIADIVYFGIVAGPRAVCLHATALLYSILIIDLCKKFNLDLLGRDCNGF